MGAVQNAMTRDGLDPTIMDLDHDKSVASQMKGDDDDVDDGPPLKEDPKYEKYFKMLKMVRFRSLFLSFCAYGCFAHILFSSRASLWALFRMR
jgi:hypothetical protein